MNAVDKSQIFVYVKSLWPTLAYVSLCVRRSAWPPVYYFVRESCIQCPLFFSFQHVWMDLSCSWQPPVSKPRRHFLVSWGVFCLRSVPLSGERGDVSCRSPPHGCTRPPEELTNTSRITKTRNTWVHICICRGNIHTWRNVRRHAHRDVCKDNTQRQTRGRQWYFWLTGCLADSWHHSKWSWDSHSGLFWLVSICGIFAHLVYDECDTRCCWKRAQLTFFLGKGRKPNIILKFAISCLFKWPRHWLGPFCIQTQKVPFGVQQGRTRV